MAGASVLSAQQYSYRQYGPQQGLTNLVVHALAEDRQGHVWVSTDNGAFRYDGHRFHGFFRPQGLPSQNVVNLAQSPDGELWALTDAGLARREGERFTTVNTGASAMSRRGGLGFGSRGRLYVIRQDGLARGERDAHGAYRFTLLVPGLHSALQVWREGAGETVYLASDDRLLAWTEAGVRTVTGLPAAQWTSIVRDGAGTLWVRSRSRLFSRAVGAAAFVDRSAGVAVNTAWMGNLFGLRAGGVLVPTDDGLAVVGAMPGALIDAHHGLPADSVRAALATRDGSLWVGTFGGGLVRRLGRGEWMSWRREDGLPHNTVWSIAGAAGGGAWVATSGGLSLVRGDGRVERSWTRRDGLPGDRADWVMSLPTGGTLVATQPLGLAHIGPDARLTWSLPGRKAGLATDRYGQFALDAERRLWVAVHGHCYRSTQAVNGVQPPRFQPVRIPGLPAEAEFSGALSVARDGAVWLATSHGLVRFHHDRWRIFGQRDGLLASAVSGAVEGADGVYWLRYSDALGVTRLTLQGERVDVRHYSKRDGLPSDVVLAIATAHDEVWVSTDNGVGRLSQSRWRHYTASDGLASADCDEGALFVDGQYAWVGTSNGLSRMALQPDLVDLPGTLYASLENEGRVWPPGSMPELPYARRSLRIEFGALSYFQEGGLRFRYRLGSQQPWEETAEHVVSYAQLPAGDHVFELAAAGRDRVWSAAPLRLPFRILTPWWQSWWFYGACLALTAAAAAVLWHLRLRVLLAQKAALEKEVAARTAELQASHRKLEEIAYCDSLTSLANRRMFLHEFERRVAHSARYGDGFVLLLVDLDRFKPVNDRFGHDAGDAVLVEASRRMRENAREVDLVARLGGDEFAFLLTQAEGHSIDEFCARLAQAIAQPIRFAGQDLSIGFSAGAAVYPDHGSTPDALYKQADLALYAAKRRPAGAPCWQAAAEPLWQAPEKS